MVMMIVGVIRTSGGYREIYFTARESRKYLHWKFLVKIMWVSFLYQFSPQIMGYTRYIDQLKGNNKLT